MKKSEEIQKKKKSSELYENLNFQFVPTIKTRKIQIKKIE